MPYWTLVNLISAVVMGAGLVAAVWWLREKHPEHELLLTASGAGLVAFLALSAVLQPILAWYTWRYGMDDELLIARYGILFREEKTIPISRLQHVDLRRGPIERLFSLATLVVFTAGTEGAAFRVPGLTVARAREMRDRILAARGDDLV
ncbi:MAG: PH domain-containing protein [Planctomycetota bacterium]